VESDIDKARQELELARAMSKQLWAEHTDYARTLDPSRGVAGPEELRLLHEASDWTGRIYLAEETLFRAQHGTPGIVGTQGNYQWIIFADRDLSSLIRLCPEFVLEKYLAVTRFDGASLRLTDKEKSGWWMADVGKVFQATAWSAPEYREDWKVAYSPRVTSVDRLLSETNERSDGFDEWYVFEQPAPAGEIEAFVNWMGFRLYEPLFQWCADRFWDQMERLAPESYIGDGTVLTVVTRNSQLFERMLAVLSECE
jgi:hypothetical protein